MNYHKLLTEAIFASRFFASEEKSSYPSKPLRNLDFKPGDVLEVPFPFTDLSGFKTRPALVLAASKFDITVAYLSTHLSWQCFEDMILLPSGENGLQSNSLLRTSKLFTIAPHIVFRKIGKVSQADLQAALWCVKSYFSAPPWPAPEEPTN